MKKVTFETMGLQHKQEVMDIYNYYVKNSFAAYPENALPVDFFLIFMDMTMNYPAFAVKSENLVIGFCFLRAYNPFPVFKHTAEITYFIHPEYVGKGIGSIILEKLENEARKLNISNILASITSENEQSLSFHRKHGFKECGRFHSIGKKFGKYFDIIWMEKNIQE